MPRHGNDGDRRRSSPYNSYKDRKFQHKKSRGSDNEEVRTREQDEDRVTDRDWHHRDYRDKNVRNYRGRFRIEDRGHSRNHGRGRFHAYAGDRENHRRHRSRSRSKDISDGRPRSESKSPSRTRSKRRSGFDMAPPGAAAVPGVSEENPGVSGITQAMPGLLQNMLSYETTQVHQLSFLPLFPAQTMSQQATRHARRVYVGGLPPLANEQTIAAFFSHVMVSIGGNSAGPGDAVVNVYINHEKKFAFVEMRTVEEASNAMALDGILFEGVALRVRRPTDYNPAVAASLGPGQPSPHLNLAAAGLTPGMTSEADGADRIFVGGLPYYFSETQIKELLESFGSLRGFDLVKDRDTQNSKGYGFCIYKDPGVTDIACAALNGLKLGDKTLTVRRATMSGQVKSEQEYILAQAQQHIAMQKMALETVGVGLSDCGTGFAENPTKVLCLSEAITVEDLMDDGEYEEILQDMKEECRKFGDLINVIIPRPGLDEELQGLGKVFLEYSDASGCASARAGLSGRKFGGKAVMAIFYPEDRYYDGDYSA